MINMVLIKMLGLIILNGAAGIEHVAYLLLVQPSTTKLDQYF